MTGGAITPDEHGTHVAGTIAAVNNNGIGVSGVAGGDAARGISGAKLMSCQIFYGDKSADGAAAIKWSADHGAVISQNSWGYPADQNGDGMISDSEIAWMKNYTISGSLKDAIDLLHQVCRLRQRRQPAARLSDEGRSRDICGR